MSRDALFGLIPLLLGVFLVFWAVGDALPGFHDLLLVVGIVLISMGDTWGLERSRRNQREILRRLDMLETRVRGWPEPEEGRPAP